MLISPVTKTEFSPLTVNLSKVIGAVKSSAISLNLAPITVWCSECISIGSIVFLQLSPASSELADDRIHLATNSEMRGVRSAPNERTCATLGRRTPATPAAPSLRYRSNNSIHLQGSGCDTKFAKLPFWRFIFQGCKNRKCLDWSIGFECDLHKVKECSDCQIFVFNEASSKLQHASVSRISLAPSIILLPVREVVLRAYFVLN